MPLQNRVTPFGQIVASPVRGTLMGNRGILHDDAQIVRKTHAHQNWVSCALSFNGNKRMLIGRRFRNGSERLEKLFELYTKMTAKVSA